MGLSDEMAARAAAWDAEGDGRAVFLDCYARMTVAVDEALAAGRFDDADWVSALMARFAEYYDVSLDGGVGAEAIVEPWVVAHAAAVGNDAAPLQLLLAGVNAHINYDLVLTLVDLLEPGWAGADDRVRTSRRADYERINEIIAETADEVQDEVIERRSPSIAFLDEVLGSWDERVMLALLTRWRTQVWDEAMRMIERPSSRGADVDRLAASCARRGRWLLI